MTHSFGPSAPPSLVLDTSPWLGPESTGSQPSPIDRGQKEIKTTVPDEPDMVNHPPHYKCPNSKYNLEAIDVIKAWFLHRDHFLANAVKYILRAPYKGSATRDIRKAVWYLNAWIESQEQD